MYRLHSHSFVWLLAFGLLGISQPSIGQDQPQSDPEAQLKKLDARRTEILNRLAELRQAFPDAQADQQKAIETEFNDLVRELREENQPASLKAAQAIYAQDKTHAKAGEILVQYHYSENQYQQAAEIGAGLIEADNANPVVLNLTGASQFALHDFAKAKETLTKASQAGGPVFQQVGGLYLQACDDYAEHWKKEQEIRAKEAEADDLPRVSFKTTAGEITLELFENEAPNTVANFIRLVEDEFYDGIVFHRVIPNFMAQGGDPNTLDDDPSNVGQGGPGYTIPCECFQDNARLHFRGSLSMAHAGKDTGGSQFFLTHLPTSHLNPKPLGPRPSGHTVFGRVIEGMDVVMKLSQGDRIESASVLRKRNHPYEFKKNN